MITFFCPQCKGNLQTEPNAYHCSTCERSFPVVLGIPDFRVYPDPYIDYEDDRAKATRVADQYDKLNFNELVRYYWSITPGIPEDMVNKFVAHAEGGVERGHDYLDEIASTMPVSQWDSSTLLEVGCGTGGFLVAAAPRFKQVVGTDIAFRWLVIAKKRFEEMGMEIPLICCCAEYLPFANGTFNMAVALSVLEHVPDQQGMVDESYRVLHSPGALFIVTTNRFTLAPEPHVRVWGVGFLPRKWMEPYVRLVRRIPYKFISSLSCFELGGILKRSGFQRFSLSSASVSNNQLSKSSTRTQAIMKAYNHLRKAPALGAFIYLVGPLYHVLCFKAEGKDKLPH